jgi:hypothetical protein
MLSFRVTKYDPALRDVTGGYLRDEWTAYSDVGRVFNGEVLSRENYLEVEDAYVDVALSMLRKASIAALRVDGLERRGTESIALVEGQVLVIDEIGLVVRSMLREELWCRLEGADSFVHVGYDYYMYVAVPVLDNVLISEAARHGIFVEPYESPYATPDVA